MFHACACLLTELLEWSELNRLRRAGLRACRDEACLLPVVAERTLEGATVIRPLVDHAEGTRHDAVPAAVADVGLHVDTAELRANDRACRTRLEATSRIAMLADIRG